GGESGARDPEPPTARFETPRAPFHPSSPEGWRRARTWGRADASVRRVPPRPPGPGGWSSGRLVPARSETGDEHQHPLLVMPQRGRRDRRTGERPESEHGPQQVVRNLVDVDPAAKLSTRPSVDARPLKQRSELVAVARDDAGHRRDL